MGPKNPIQMIKVPILVTIGEEDRLPRRRERSYTCLLFEAAAGVLSFGVSGFGSKPGLGFRVPSDIKHVLEPSRSAPQ